MRKLRCEYLENPLAVGSTEPRLHWIIEEEDANRRGVRQKAFRLLCAGRRDLLEEGKADLWDSGRRESSESGAEYAGKKLGALQHVFWKVSIWDQEDRASEWSESAEFRIGRLSDAEWQGRWIGAGIKVRHPAPLLRTAFRLSTLPGRAVLYATSLGVYEARLNGKRVGDHVLAPEFTSYGRRVQ